MSACLPGCECDQHTRMSYSETQVSSNISMEYDPAYQKIDVSRPLFFNRKHDGVKSKHTRKRNFRKKIAKHK